MIKYYFKNYFFYLIIRVYKKYDPTQLFWIMQRTSSESYPVFGLQKPTDSKKEGEHRGDCYWKHDR